MAIDPYINGALPYSGTTSKADAILQQLSLEEKVALCGAEDWWRTVSIRRGNSLLLPHLKTTDGPNGARGESYVSGIKAACFPCAENTAASFDTTIAYEIGKAVALEARTKSSDILLAPTVCMVRSPLGGRNHETFGEDPLVLGSMGAAYVNGCQSVGIAATPKHFVANEVEYRRRFVSVEIEERALREIYLYPFQHILKYSDPWCWMTSYNRVNGTYASEHPHLLQDILRKEWGYKGLIMSDWVGTYSTVEAMNAGLDLEMPAPLFHRGEALLRAVNEGKVSESTISQSAKKVIEVVLKSSRMQEPEDREETYAVDAERDEFIARAAAEGIVLLKNDNNILPLKRSSSVVVIGQHAADPPVTGGGSAKVPVEHVVTPLEGLKAAGVNFTYEPGVPIYGAVPVPHPRIVFPSSDCESSTKVAKPVRIEWFNGSTIGKNLVKDDMVATTEYMIKERWPEYLDQDYCTRMTFDLKPETSGPHIFSVITTGTAKLYVNGEEIFHREQEPVLQREAFYFFRPKIERKVTYEMQAHRRYSVTFESWATPSEIVKASIGGEVVQGSAVAFTEHVDIPVRIQSAAEAARSHDVAFIFTGTTPEIESEGFDRPNMDLMPLEYELIDAVSAANPNTIIVNISGSPVSLTEACDKIAGLVQTWFLGQESGTSIARVLTGEVNPSGKLPISWPRRLEDNPSHGNWPGDKNDIIRYEEGIFVGYRHYEKYDVKPLFPFGHGLSYTTFEIRDLEVPSSSRLSSASSVDVSCIVTNTGAITGKTVVQFYVSRASKDSKFNRPVKELKAFQKLLLNPGSSTALHIRLDKHAFSCYDTTSSAWRVEEGMYEVHAGFSSADIAFSSQVHVEQSFTWSGL